MVIKLMLLILFLVAEIVAGKIVMPWRAKKEIVKHGESFTIWLIMDELESVDSVRLIGPYNSLTLTMDSVTKGSWYYDDYTLASYNIKVHVSIPIGTPIELYDLSVATSNGKAVSNGSVKIIHEYLKHYNILHFSDPHSSVAWNSDGNATGPVQEALVEFLNIVDPEFAICTGDNIIGFTRSSAQPDTFPQRWDHFFDGNFKGVGGLDNSRVPLFISTGNNDYDKYKADQDSQKFYKLTDWNEYVGMRVFGFSYDETRVMSFDDYLVEVDDHGGNGVAKDFPGEQIRVLEKFLVDEGQGQLRITMQHAPNRVNTSFINDNDVQVSLVGHVHRNDVANIGNSTTRLTTAQLVFAEYWGGYGPPPNSVDARIRLLEIKDHQVVSYNTLNAFDYAAEMRGENGKYLDITYSSPNNGSVTSNQAVLQNDINYNFISSKIRFVMEKGRYVIDNGLIHQVFSNDTATIVDVKIDMTRNSSEEVNISPDLTPIYQSNRWNGEILLNHSRVDNKIFLTKSSRIKTIKKITFIDLTGRILYEIKQPKFMNGQYSIEKENLWKRDFFFLKVDFELNDGQKRKVHRKVTWL